MSDMSTQEKRKLVKRIARLSRTAAVYRLRGDIPNAQRLESTIDALSREAERQRVASAALQAEHDGLACGSRLFHKARRARLSRLRKS